MVFAWSRLRLTCNNIIPEVNAKCSGFRKLRLVLEQESLWLPVEAFQMTAHCFLSSASISRKPLSVFFLSLVVLNTQSIKITAYPSCVESVSFLSWPKHIVGIRVIHRWRRLFDTKKQNFKTILTWDLIVSTL